MSELVISARFDVHAGKLDEVQTIIAAAIQKVRANEPRTLQYNWYHSDDHSSYIVLERYEDSDALLEHLADVGDVVGIDLATPSTWEPLSLKAKVCRLCQEEDTSGIGLQFIDIPDSKLVALVQLIEALDFES